jgi:hypothetical protein
MVLKVFSAKLFIFQRKFSKKKLCYVWCLKQVLKSGFIIQKKLGIPGQSAVGQSAVLVSFWISGSLSLYQYHREIHKKKIKRHYLGL